MTFVPIADPSVVKIPIQECGEPLVDVAGQDWMMVEPVSQDSYGLSKVRQSVADRLKIAAASLPEDVRFKLFEGFRPMHIQQEYFDEYVGMVKKEHPDWNDAQIRKEASVFVAPPDIVPPHTTGGAVDVFLIDAQGKEYELGGGNSHHIGGYGNISHTDSQEISTEQRSLRQILISAMTDAGFVNYPAEWWHWSYGDRYWAMIQQQPFAIYGTTQ